MRDIQNRVDIELLVYAFYKQALEDELIGFFFTKIVQLDWEVHIPVICDFWETVLFHNMKYKGNPMLKHIHLSQKQQLETAHFERWIFIWESTIENNFKGIKANEAIQKAKQIGALMKYKIKQAS